MQATTTAAGQAIERQFKNTTTAMFPTHLNTAITVGRTDTTPTPASSPIQNTGLFASVSCLAVLLGRITDPPPLSGIYVGQDGWSPPATSGRPMSGMGSS